MTAVGVQLSSDDLHSCRTRVNTVVSPHMLTVLHTHYCCITIHGGGRCKHRVHHPRAVCAGAYMKPTWADMLACVVLCVYGRMQGLQRVKLKRTLVLHGCSSIAGSPAVLDFSDLQV
jgi:hypothetical protein